MKASKRIAMTSRGNETIKNATKISRFLLKRGVEGRFVPVLGLLDQGHRASLESTTSTRREKVRGGMAATRDSEEIKE